MGLNLSNFAPMLKTMYTKEKVENLVYKKQAFAASVAKGTEFFGESKTVPLIFGNPQGRSADFATAQGNKGNTSSAKFIVTRAKDYGLISVDNETIKASQNDAGAFAQARTVEIDGMFQNLTNSMAIDLIGDGSGKRGTIDGVSSVSSSTGVITLADPNDIVKFEVNMKLQFSATADGTGSVRAGYAFIKSINRKVGSFVVSATAGGAACALDSVITSPVNTDSIFAAGDYGTKIKGLSAWLPYGGPSATTFFGLDRTVDSTRLAGQWADLTSYPIEEALIEAHKVMDREGAAIDKMWISQSKAADLRKALGTRVQFVDQKIGSMSFRGIELQTGEGVITVMADRNIAKNDLFALQSDTWKFETLGEAPQILNMDSLESLREATADAIEIRLGWYGQLICNAPGYNGHFHI